MTDLPVGRNGTNDTQSCGQELMGPFGLVMQGALALLAFSTLICEENGVEVSSTTSNCLSYS